MRLQFKHQKFQADAARAVCDVFAGQPYMTPTYMIDMGRSQQISLLDLQDFTGWNNQPLIPELNDERILEQLQAIQRRGQIMPSANLEGRYNLTVEMETGVGKTYTYIKTMYELNKRYGWSKFIIVVPSIAIREGVYKSFQVTAQHFKDEYGKEIRHFIYNSGNLTEIDRFASDPGIYAMIINSQAFNAKGKDARRIYMELDEFRSRRPIDVIAKTNPILIIDEPQSVEGKQTKERLKEFNPLFTLRYSATPREQYNLVYRLDAMEAYNKRLVKKIAVKGITESGSTATEGNDAVKQALEAAQGSAVEVVYVRSGEQRQTSLTPVWDASSAQWRAGMWVRDSSAGVGTMTFVDRQLGVFAGLGHPISDSDTGESVALRSGEIVACSIVGCTSGTIGSPGELKGKFLGTHALGSIGINGPNGVYGTLRTALPGETRELAFAQEVVPGEAEIWATTEGEAPRAYKVRIEKVNDADPRRNMILRVTDPALLAKTGGIVQGMSGSPILQNGRLVGAVTHVLVNDPTRGYGIFAQTMLEQAQQAAKTDHAA